MTRQGYRTMLAACLLLLVTGALLAPAPARAQVSKHIDWLQNSTGVPEKFLPGWPPSGAAWRELYPVFNTIYREDNKIDIDHNLEVSGGDYILLRTGSVLPVWYRIAWAGPTYFLRPPGSSAIAFEPLTQNPPALGPVGELWRRIYPVFGAAATVSAWSDANLNSTPDTGDTVTLGGVAYVIERVGLDALIEPGDPIATEPGTWSRVKSLYDER